MTKHVDTEGIGNIRTLPEAKAVLDSLLSYPVTPAILNPLLRTYTTDPGQGTQVLPSEAKEGKTRTTDHAFLQLAAMAAANTSMIQLRNHVRRNLPENSAYAHLSNEKVIEAIEKGLRVTRKNLIDVTSACYTNLMKHDCEGRVEIHNEILSWLGKHFTSVDVDGSVDHLLNNRNHTRYTTYYQINFPEEASGSHTYDRVFLVMTYVPETNAAWLNLLPHYAHAGSFHPGDRINLNQIGASLVNQLSRYDLL